MDRRAMVVVLVAVLFSLGLVPAAVAAPPEKEPNVSYEEHVRNDCGFPIQFQAYSGGFLRTWIDKGAVFIQVATGGIHVVMTNVETGESIERNASGPGMYREYADGSWTYKVPGPSIIWEHGIEDLPALLLHRGLWVWSGDAEGNLDYSYSGSVEDLCQTLS